MLVSFRCTRDFTLYRGKSLYSMCMWV